MFRALHAFFLLLFFANFCYAGSEKDLGLPPAKVIKNISEIKILNKKQYPTYQDVSGYDLSAYQMVKEGVAGITAYRMDDGDIWFIFAASYKDVVETREKYRIYKDYTGVKFILLKFFNSERIELTESQLNELHKLLKPKEMVLIHNILVKHDWPWVKFSDGSEVVYEYGTGGSLCSHFEVARSFLVKIYPESNQWEVDNEYKNLYNNHNYNNYHDYHYNDYCHHLSQMTHEYKVLNGYDVLCGKLGC